MSALLLMTPAIAQANGKIALILGDGKYSRVPDAAFVEGTALIKNALEAAGYKTIEERNGSWSAELLNLNTNDTVTFKQPETGMGAGQAVMYGRYGLEGGTRNKFVLQVSPKRNGRVSLNIPNIGVCALGQLE
ncbi:hypothetical protein EOI86_07750 [Hwanghaeella grinnelliae]|uniref:Uncharacterized protein n=1 Tax=Hwanghaeella grinnelliae TaxID=2500179 RepID=A0A3S2VT04_9PROT|nr:hypothetical protein [Hwanghaeella grinnelliae]RVU39133.1 hypothetical protein EOI86_07750 [Hwanghaeella grinnelliae]